MPKVFDLFLFNGEPLIELRFALHADFVDYFVVGEALTDFSGNSKTQKFEINKFAEFKDKIIYLQFDSSHFEHCLDNWERERHCRELLVSGLSEARDSDFVMISDCDELIDPSFFPLAMTHQELIIFSLKNFRFFGNYHCLTYPNWRKPVIFRKSLLNTYSIYDISLCHINKRVFHDGGGRTFFDCEKEIEIHTILNSGWHFSYLGGYEEVVKKIEHFGPNFLPKNSWVPPHHQGLLNFRIWLGHDFYYRRQVWGTIKAEELGNEVVCSWLNDNGYIRKPALFHYKGRLDDLWDYPFGHVLGHVIKRIVCSVFMLFSFSRRVKKYIGKF